MSTTADPPVALLRIGAFLKPYPDLSDDTYRAERARHFAGIGRMNTAFLEAGAIRDQALCATVKAELRGLEQEVACANEPG